jgi:hypothetical protein
MSFSRKIVLEKLKDDNISIVRNVSLLGLGTFGVLTQNFKFNERKSKKFEKIGYNLCGTLINKKKTLRCKMYFLKKKFNEESNKIYKRIEKLDSFYNKNPNKDDETNAEVIEYHKQWKQLNDLWKDLARRVKNDINRLKDEYEGEDKNG